MIGRTISHYEIVEKIGEGGMGEVYRARDTRLGRDVALKILPDDLARSANDLQRFEREARTVAALDHPNVVTVYDIETVEGMTFMAMQLVDGQPLHKMIGDGGMQLERIFKIATPIADALSAAHEAGVTHRDLKPGNIVVGKDDRVHVLDFGLAKVGGGVADPSDATQALTEHLTAEGQIVGTVSYMSPEQAQGKEVDSRSDIFSFGVVLYQMSTGQLPFGGENHISVITSILRDQPSPVTEKNRRLPRHLARIVRRCLQKEPAKRYQSAKDLRLDLESLQLEIESGEWSGSEISVTEIADEAVSSPARPRWRTALAGAALVALGLAGGLFLARPDVSNVPTSESGVETPMRRLVPLAQESGVQAWPSLTPDGDWFVYHALDGGDWDIFLRSVGGDNPINLTASASSNDRRPVVSPDGREIVFTSDRQGGGLFVMGRTGESVRRVAEGFYDPAWSPDGRQLVVSGEEVVSPYGREDLVDLSIIDLDTGQVRPFLTDQDAVEPDWSPSGARIAFWGLRKGSGQRDLWTVSVADGSLVPVTDDASTEWNPTWSPDGRFLYFSSDRGGVMDLWRMPIDEHTGATLGAPEPVTMSGSSWSVKPSFSADGTRIVFTEEQRRRNIHRIPFDPVTRQLRGAPEPVATGARAMVSPAPSPDGEWIAFSTGGSEAEDIYIMRSDGSEMTRLTNDAAKDRRPRWSPDGQRLAFYSDRGGEYEAWVVDRDGRGLRSVAGAPGCWAGGVAWSATGDSIIANLVSIAGGWSRVYMVPIDPDSEFDLETARVIREDPTAQRFLPAQSDASGRRVVGTRSNPNGTASVAVLDLDTSELTAYHTIDAATGFAPVWVPGTSHVVVLMDQAIQLLDTTTRDLVELHSFAPAFLTDNPSTSSDGRWIYLAPLHLEVDIWMLEIGS